MRKGSSIRGPREWRGKMEGVGRERRQRNSSPETYNTRLKRCSSLCRLLRGSKGEAESPIHKGGQRQEGESDNLQTIFVTDRPSRSRTDFETVEECRKG